MSKYVNADALKWLVAQYKGSSHLSKEAALNLVKAAIDAAPNSATDAVEVVRCKDCAHWNRKDGSGDKEWGICNGFRHGNGISYANNFCSDGEARE